MVQGKSCLSILFEVPCSVGDKVDKTPEVGLSPLGPELQLRLRQGGLHGLDCTEEKSAPTRSNLLIVLSGTPYLVA